MATDLEKFREKYPQYNDLSDLQVADNLHDTYYSDISKNDFYKRVGLKPQTGWKAVGEDAKDVVKNILPALGQIISNAPGQLKDLAGLGESGEYSTDRARNVGAAGLADYGRGILNAPANVLDYFREKEITPSWLQAARPEWLNNEDYHQRMGINDERPGDAIVNNIAPILNAALTIPAITKTAAKVGKAVVKTTAKTSKRAAGAVYEKGRNAIGYNTQAELAHNAGEIAKSTAEKLARTDVAAAKASGNKVITSLFEDTKKMGITKAEIKRTYAQQMFKHLDPKERAIVAKAFRNPTLENIHEASKTMRTYAHELRSAKKITPELRTRLYQAKAVASNLENSLMGAFEKGRPGGAAEYVNWKKSWQKNVIHLERHPLFKKYLAGELTPEQFIKDLAKDKKWLSRNVGKNVQVPELARVLAEMEDLPPGVITTPDVNQLNMNIKRHNLVKNIPRKVGKVVTKAVIGSKLNK